MNYERLNEHIKKNGITLVTVNDGYNKIPSGTKLYFGINCDNKDKISTYSKDTMGLNRYFGYNFEYLQISPWENYKGTFSISSEYPCENYVWLKEGDLVDISPKLANHPGFAKWRGVHKKIAGKKGLKIKSIDYGHYEVYDDDHDSYEAVPAIYVKKHIPEVGECVCSCSGNYCSNCGRKLIK